MDPQGMSSSQHFPATHPATLRKFSTSQFVLHGRSRETGRNGHVAMASVHHNCGCGLRVSGSDHNCGTTPRHLRDLQKKGGG
jgi:hypothetical protein